MAEKKINADKKAEEAAMQKVEAVKQSLGL